MIFSGYQFIDLSIARSNSLLSLAFVLKSALAAEVIYFAVLPWLFLALSLIQSRD